MNQATAAYPNSPIPAINWEAFQAQFQGRQAFIIKLLGVLLTSHSQTADKIRQSVQNDDLQQLAFLTHSFAGAVGQVHADTLRAEAKDIEKQAKEGERQALAQAESLAQAIDEFMLSVQQYTAANTD